MRVNLSEVFDFPNNQRNVKVYNMAPYLMRAIEIYFICEDPILYSYILTPILPEYSITDEIPSPQTCSTYYDITNNRVMSYDFDLAEWAPLVGVDNNGNAKISITIDGVLYPIKYNSRGESPTNPIIFKRTSEFSKISLFSENGTRYEMLAGPNDNTWEEIQNNEISQDKLNPNDEITIGTNRNINDDVSILFKVLPGILTSEKKFSYGGNGYDEQGSFVESDRDGFGGYRDEMTINGITTSARKVEAYGGIVPDAILKDAIFVFQRSDYVNLENVSEDVVSIQYNVGVYSPVDIAYGGVYNIEPLLEVTRGVRY